MTKFLTFGFVIISAVISAQTSSFLKPSDTLNIKRRNAVVISETILGVSSLAALDRMWYSDYDRSSFKTKNDIGDWYGMDKYGHIYSSYQLGRYGNDVLEWSGVSKKDQLLYGATLGLAFLTAVEVMDGFSQEWGFSWGDMAANALGTGIFVGQELLWQEQRMTLKFSYHSTRFSNSNPSQLGESNLERLFKDYNGQTYWLSFNLRAFAKLGFFPPWLNMAIGYGADGMLNPDFGDPLLPMQNPVRQYYLSLDVDLTRIKTNSRLLKTLFDVFNLIKVPAPTLELDNSGRLKFHYLYF